MVSWITARSLALAGALVGALVLVGCSGGGGTPQASNAGPLNSLSAAYLRATAKLNRPPKDAAELQAHLGAGEKLESLLTSPNDNQPYVILWGADPRSGMDLKPLVIAYEKEGQGGVRFVFTAMGVMTMGAEDFKEANFPQGHKPG
ncbi:MAG: hypothetical protein U0939_04590 [Pirellulales bacterium]